MEFASEMVVKSAIQKLRITEVPTKLFPDGRTRPPHLRTWHDGWRHLRFLLLFSPRWLFLYTGLTLMLLGIFITVALLSGPIHIRKIGFDVHTMLYGSSFIFIGFQVIAFFFFSKTYAVNAELDPDKAWLEKMNRLFSLERGIVSGAIIFLFGIILTIYSLLTWNSYSFGHLDPSHMLRLVIPSVTFLVIGIQLIFYSFFLSILGFKKQ
jgi:hypothetical protein